MPDFSPCPIHSDAEVNQWLKVISMSTFFNVFSLKSNQYQSFSFHFVFQFYEMEAPLNVLSVLVSRYSYKLFEKKNRKISTFLHQRRTIRISGKMMIVIFRDPGLDLRVEHSHGWGGNSQVRSLTKICGGNVLLIFFREGITIMTPPLRMLNTWDTTTLQR